MVSRYVESAEEVAAAIAERPPAEATAWFADWLHRRDKLSAEMAVEQFADGLEKLAAELRGEAHHESTARTRGLILAAGVLLDAAGGIRVGDIPTTE